MADPTTPTISRDELKAKVDRGDPFRLVETLPGYMYRQGHLPGAVNLPPDKVKELAPKVLPDKAAEVVVYCGGGT
jgi:rhodanese-related sulfurtransferase